MPVDFLGQELNVGDNVVFLNHCRTSSSLGRGKITSISEHTVIIDLATRRAEYKVVKIPCMEHGHWIYHDDGVVTCSKCGNAECSDSYYCRYCGAKMDKEGEDDV